MNSIKQKGIEMSDKLKEAILKRYQHCKMFPSRVKQLTGIDAELYVFTKEQLIEALTSKEECSVFMPEVNNTSATKCKFCGHESWEHPVKHQSPPPEEEVSKIDSMKNEIEMLSSRIERARDYLMQVEANKITVEDTLVSLGFNESGFEPEKMTLPVTITE